MGKEPCPACGRRTLSERGAYDICSACGWEDDGDDRPWIQSGPNGGETLWSARLRAQQPTLRGKARARELERLREEAVAAHGPPYLAGLGRTLGVALTLADVTGDVEEADRLSLTIHGDGRNAPAVDPDDAWLTPAQVDAALARSRPQPPALLLDLRFESLLGGVRIDPAVVVARWRAYVEAHTPFLVLAAPDLAGTLTLMPSGGGWHLTITGDWT